MTTAIDRLMRRVQHMVGVGRTTAPVDDTGMAQTVQAQTYAGIPVSGIKISQLFGLSTVAPVGSDVVLLNIAGDSSAPIAIATGHQGSRPKGTVPGGSVLYDQIGTNLTMSNDGNAMLTATGTFTIKIGSMMAVFSAAGLAITGGMITADGDVIAGQGTDDQVSELHHLHTSGEPGSPTSVPIAGT